MTLNKIRQKKFFVFLSLFVFLLFFTPFFPSFAANCNSTSPKITVTTITTQQPDPTPKFLKSEILNKNRITQTTDVYGGAIVRVTVEDPTNNSCYFNRLGNISGCKMTKTERKAGQVVATSTSYFLQPSSKQFIFTPKDLTSNLVLDFSCGTASGKYSIGSTICERPFDQIVGDLEAQKPTIITEKSFSDWAKEDKFDSCGFGLFGLLKCNNKYPYPNPPYVNSPVKSANSGDKEDIVKYLIKEQCEYKCSAEGNFETCKRIYFNSWSEEKDKPDVHNTVNALKVFTEIGFPTLISVRNLDWGAASYSGPTTTEKIMFVGHAVILIGVTQEQSSYNLKVVDPNYPDEITEIKNCRTSDIMFKYAGKTREIGGDLYCSDSQYGPIGVGGLQGSLKELDVRAGAYNNLCYSSDSNNFKNLCSRRPLTKWLENNLISIVNPSDNGGNCLSWAKFVLDVTYQGNFGYECPRPGSGSASTLKSLQLANIQESINQIIEQIKNLKIKAD